MKCLGTEVEGTSPGKLFRQWDLDKKGSISFSDVMEKVDFVIQAMSSMIK
jgi:hypothetical protein